MDRTEDFERKAGGNDGGEKTENTKKRARDFLNGLMLGLLAGVLLVACIYLGLQAFDFMQIRGTSGISIQSNDSGVVSIRTMQKMNTIQEAIEEYYYGDEVTVQELQDGVYKGMIEALGDPYSEYYTSMELEEAVNSNQGISYGIGAYISLNKQMNMPMINGVMDESPAQEAGLREGDIIYMVDDEYTQGMSTTAVVALVKGREGTSVHLTIYREGEADYLEMDVVRGKMLETTTVDSGMVEDSDGIGYLRIREFDVVTVDQYAEAMAELKANGMKSLILDLRSNPGGDLNAVVEIARRILPKGMIVYTEDKNGKRSEYTCDGTRELDIPLVVLVNGYSASASEVLAGAIQDYGKGTLIGTTTYGKGIVQRIHRLDDGTALKLTISAYFTPSGRNIHGIGIVPDIELEYDYEANEADGTDNQVEEAIRVLEEQSRN